MNAIKALRLLTRPTTRAMSSGAVKPQPKYAPLNARLKAKQELFQIDNDIPVHLKGGRLDYALYIITLAACAIGVVEVGRTIYILSFPRKPSS